MPPPTNGGTVVIECDSGDYQLTLADMNIDIDMNVTIAGPANQRPVFTMPTPDSMKPTGNYLFSIAATAAVSVDNCVFNGAPAPTAEQVLPPTVVAVNHGVLAMHSCAISGAVATEVDHDDGDDLLKFGYALYAIVIGDQWPTCALLDCTETPLTDATLTTLENVEMTSVHGGIFLSAGLASVKQSIVVDSSSFRSMQFVNSAKSNFAVAVYGGFPLDTNIYGSVVEVNGFPENETGEPEAVIRFNSLMHCDPTCASNKNKRIIELTSVHFAQNKLSPPLLALKGPAGLRSSQMYFEQNTAHDQTPAMVILESISDTIWTTGNVENNNYPVGILVNGQWDSQTTDIAGLLSLNNINFANNQGVCLQSLSNCFLLEVAGTNFNGCSRGAVLLQGGHCAYPDTSLHVMKFATTNFFSNGDIDQYGGGVGSRGAYGSLNFADVVFEENIGLMGAGIYASDSSPTEKIGGIRLSNTRFMKNTARAAPFLIAAEGIPIYISDRSRASDNVGCTATQDANCPAVSCDEIRYVNPSPNAGQLLSCQNFAATHGGYVAAIIIVCMVGVGLVLFTIFRYIKNNPGPFLITTPPDFSDEPQVFGNSETSRLTDNL